MNDSIAAQQQAWRNVLGEVERIPNPLRKVKSLRTNTKVYTYKGKGDYQNSNVREGYEAHFTVNVLNAVAALAGNWTYNHCMTTMVLLNNYSGPLLKQLPAEVPPDEVIQWVPPKRVKQGTVPPDRSTARSNG